MINKLASSIISITFASLIVLPASAQLTGTLGSTLGAGANANRNRGGMRGDLGLDQTMNGTLNRGDRNLGVDTASTIDGTADMRRHSEKKTSENRPVLGSAADRTHAQVNSVTRQMVEAGSQVTSSATGKVDASNRKAADTLNSTQVTASVESAAQVNANATPTKHDSSASSDVSSSKALRANLGAKQVTGDADMDSHASVKAQGGSNQADVAARSSNSGSAKLHGRDHAESRVKSTTAASAIDRNEKTQAKADASSDTHASVKAQR